MSRGSARGVAPATPPEIRYGSWGARPTLRRVGDRPGHGRHAVERYPRDGILGER